MIPFAFFRLSIGEMLAIAVGALLVFGGRLPDVMRNLGRTYAKFRHGMNEVTHPLRQEMRRIDLETAPGAVPTISRRPAALEAPKREVADEGDDPAVADQGVAGPTDTGAGSLGPDDAPHPPSASSPWSGGVADEPPPV